MQVVALDTPDTFYRGNVTSICRQSRHEAGIHGKVSMTTKIHKQEMCKDILHRQPFIYSTTNKIDTIKHLLDCFAFLIEFGHHDGTGSASSFGATQFGPRQAHGVAQKAQ